MTDGWECVLDGTTRLIWEVTITRSMRRIFVIVNLAVGGEVARQSGRPHLFSGMADSGLYKGVSIG